MSPIGVRLEENPTKASYKAYWENGVYMGDILMDVDGYYKWWPERNGGYLDEWILYSMFHTLKELNREWDKHIHDNFSSGHGEHNMEQGESL